MASRGMQASSGEEGVDAAGRPGARCVEEDWSSDEGGVVEASGSEDGDVSEARHEITSRS